MKKRFTMRAVSMLLCLVMVMSLLPLTGAAAQSFEDLYFPSGKIATPKAPYLVYERNDVYSDMILMWYNPSEELRKLYEAQERYYESDKDFEEFFGVYDFNVTIQTDVKIDNGAWQYTAEWDDPEWSGVDSIYGLTFSTCNRAACDGYYVGKTLSDLYYIGDDISGAAFLRPAVTQGVNEYGDPVYHFDLKGHTVSVRYRFAVSISHEYAEYQAIFSDWSPAASIGKNGNQKAHTAPKSLAAPILSDFYLDVDETNGTSGRYFVNFPESVYDALIYCEADQDAFQPMYLQAQMRVNGGAWEDVYTANPNAIVEGFRSAAPDGSGLKESDKIEVRARIESDFLGMVSPWSNIVGTKANYVANDWAQSYIAEADALGLIPDCLKDADLTQPISRAEFAAVAVKVYESLSGKTAVAGAAFADCTDAEVRKAVAIGITNGTDAAKNLFSPNETVNREQAATMLTRAFKACTFSGWTLATDSSYAEQFRALFTMPAAFDDDSTINGYAKDSVYFMAANGIINGVGYYETGDTIMYNAFLPRNRIYREQAEQLGLATREQAMKIAVCMVQNLA